MDISNNIGIDKIILGTVQFGLNYGINNQSGKPSDEQIFSILDEASRCGINRLDTADAYGEAMAVIGRYHQKKKGTFKILSKFSFSDSNKNIAQKLKRALKILGVDSLEVYSYHSFQDFVDNQESQEMLSAFKKQKLIKKIGISVYTNREFETVIDSKIIDVIQIPCNVFDNCSKKGALIARAKKNGKEIHVRSVFLQGLFFMNEDKIVNKLKPLVPYLKTVKAFCKKEKMSVSELALTYAVFNPGVDGVLIGVDNLKQLAENLNCLNPAHFEKINDFAETLNIKEIELLNPVNWK